MCMYVCVHSEANDEQSQVSCPNFDGRFFISVDKQEK